MKSVYVFARGNADGIFGTASLLKVVNDAFFTFTKPRFLDSAVRRFVRGAVPEAYFIGIQIDPAVRGKLFSTIDRQSDTITHYYGQLPPPQGAPFTCAHVDGTMSSGEKVYLDVRPALSPMIPAIASLNTGFRETPLIRIARDMYGDRLDANAELVRFGLAMSNVKFKNDLVYAIKNSRYPDELPWLVAAAEQARERWDALRQEADRVCTPRETLVHGEFSGAEGFRIMLAEYMADQRGLPVGITGTRDVLDRLSIASRSPYLHIGEIVRNAAMLVRCSGSGTRVRAGATVPRSEKARFFTYLDQQVRTALPRDVTT